VWFWPRHGLRLVSWRGSRGWQSVVVSLHNQTWWQRHFQLIVLRLTAWTLHESWLSSASIKKSIAPLALTCLVKIGHKITHTHCSSPGTFPLVPWAAHWAMAMS